MCLVDKARARLDGPYRDHLRSELGPHGLDDVSLPTAFSICTRCGNIRRRSKLAQNGDEIIGRSPYPVPVNTTIPYFYHEVLNALVRSTSAQRDKRRQTAMVMYRLRVRTFEGVWEDEVDSYTSLVVLAALSAEPESFAELAQAVRRYQPEHQMFDQVRQSGELYGDAADGPWCLIDLLGRTVVAGAGFELPDPRGAYKADADDHA